jgi:cysteine-rich repeat protein
MSATNGVVAALLFLVVAGGCGSDDADDGGSSGGSSGASGGTGGRASGGEGGLSDGSGGESVAGSATAGGDGSGGVADDGGAGGGRDDAGSAGGGASGGDRASGGVPSGGQSGASDGGATIAGSAGTSDAGAPNPAGEAGAGGESNGEGGSAGHGHGGASTTALCGDGIVQAKEGCDDANSQTGDGCSADCRRVVELAAAGYFTCARLDDGALKCWGENDSGQLGQGDTQARGGGPDELGTNLPRIELGSGRHALRVAAGHYHVCAILDDGSLKCWGRNEDGQLGLGDTANRGTKPGEMSDQLPTVNLGTGRTVRSVALGIGHSCAVLDNGRVKCWGNNTSGQLGLGDVSARGDQPGEMGDALPTVDLGTGRTAQWVAAYNEHTCALLDDDTLKCWGQNVLGQLGLGDQSNRGSAPGTMGDQLPSVDLGTNRTAKAVALGWFVSCALLDDESVKCWGYNYWGQNGQGDNVPARGYMPGQMGDQLPAVRFAGGRTARSISAGWSHVCAELNDGAIQCWGANLYGQLGLGDDASRGDDPGETPNQLPDIPLGMGNRVKSFVAGYNHVCVLLQDDAMKCWGQRGAWAYGDTLDRGDEPGELGDALPTVLLP